MRTSTYAEYLTHISALIGVDQADFQTTETTFLNSFFNKAIRKIWESSNWTDVCPKGEVRFAKNSITYPNDLSQSVWTKRGSTATAAQVANPLDGRVTASSLVETSGGTFHYVLQSFDAVVGNTYVFSGYFRANGRNYVMMDLTDSGVNYCEVYFDLVNGIATPGLKSGFSIYDSKIQQLANGFYFVSLSVKWISGSLSTGAANICISADGLTYSYSGTAGLGLYSWGLTVSCPSSNLPALNYISWEQDVENAIDVLFEVWSKIRGLSCQPIA